MKKIEFTADFATKKKGDVLQCDGQLASYLVHEDKVAKYVNDIEVVEPKIVKAKK